jgi:hypothetical protein
MVYTFSYGTDPRKVSIFTYYERNNKPLKGELLQKLPQFKYFENMKKCIILGIEYLKDNPNECESFMNDFLSTSEGAGYRLIENQHAQMNHSGMSAHFTIMSIYHILRVGIDHFKKHCCNNGLYEDPFI